MAAGRRILNRRWPLATTLAVIVALTGCTGDHPSSEPSSQPRPQPSGDVSSPPAPPAHAHPTHPTTPVTVISERTPAAATAALATVLFAAADLVVLSADDDADIAQAARTATAQCAPLLVVDATGPPVATLLHLHTRQVITYGTITGLPPGISIVGPPADMPSINGDGDHEPSTRPADQAQPTAPATRTERSMTTPPDAGQPTAAGSRQSPPAGSHHSPAAGGTADLRDTAVLVDRFDGRLARAVTATAQATGVRVVEVQGTDPRADPDAIAALHAVQPRYTIAVGDFGPPALLASRLAVAGTGVQLPAGGQVIFPGRRFVALYGHPDTPSLGVLGAQDLPASVQRAEDLAARYQALSDVPVVPTFEIIAAVAQRNPGADGDFTAETDPAVLRPWVEAAQQAGMYVVLDLQPGRADPLRLAQRYAALLVYPHVGLAVDPEWALAPGVAPLQRIGSLDAQVLNSVAAWLDGFTAARHLPQKLFVIHQFQLSMIGNERALRVRYDNLAVLIHMDGQGSPPDKEATWRSVVGAAPAGVSLGWKNFYREDHPMLSPEQTMAHQPSPLMISYQ